MAAVIRDDMAHPQAWGLSVPYGTPLLRMATDPSRVTEYLKAARQSVGGPFDRTRAIMLMVEDAVGRAGLEQSQKTTLWAQAESQTAQNYAMFCEHGRIIYDFAPHLTAAFDRSNLGEARVEDIRLPANAFYMRFRADKPHVLGNGRPLDGVYVFMGKDGAFIGLNFVSRHAGRWPDVGDVGVAADIQLDGPPETLLTEALEAGFRDSEARFQDLLRQAAAQRRLMPGEFDFPQFDHFRKSQDDVRGLIDLVCNALLFLSAYPDEVEDDWNDGAPAKLVERTADGAAKKAAKAKDELWFLGYARVRWAGRREHREMQARAASGERASPEGHWRTGHWRRQPWGPRRSLRKAMWIRPVWVGAAGDDDHPKRGRIVEIE
jgi:hypothetical protein